MHNSASNHLSIGASAKYLGVSIDTLRRWDKKGKLASHRSLGGHRYFLKEDLDNVFNKPHHRDVFKSELPKPEVSNQATGQIKIETPAMFGQTPIITEEAPAIPAQNVQISTEQSPFPQGIIEIPQSTPVQITETQQIAISVNPQPSNTAESILSNEELIAKAKLLTAKPTKLEKEANGSILKIMLWSLFIFALIDLIIVIYLIISRSTPPIISPVP